METVLCVNGFDVLANYSDAYIDDVLKPLLATWAALYRRLDRRIVVFLAAPPATGKSTLGAFLAWLSRTQPEFEPVDCVGIDGFHLSNDVLASRTVFLDGREVSMKRIKGAPETFDLPALSNKISETKCGGCCMWPLYDRTLHDPVQDAVAVDAYVILVEGNYLLLDEAGWRDLGWLADQTVLIVATPEELRDRLVERKVRGGMAKGDAESFVDASDMANVRRVLENSMKADVTIAMPW